MNLWDWSLRAWRAPGVETACLDLQDAQGQNIPLLLWAAWTAVTGRSLAEDDIEAACDTARVWHETVIVPLRGVRRALKTRVPDLGDEDREAVRAQVQAVEIDAERRLLAALEALAPPPVGPAKPALPALVAVSRAWSSVTPRTALTLLAERLPA
ncbi:TIGR02444 family protein [Brevundimonas viscosa]|uniref:TIGR02444 family protein n=1 Tax=Brevundimonas viscosa TaxID=871741 RepID=A0A1I6SUP9_9CAUL|nr:TIGR02444 family protein [Brevundimonas viscosa]SFS80646.1 TIGR02444 family protein [Brevundimonas viscosa]